MRQRIITRLPRIVEENLRREPGSISLFAMNMLSDSQECSRTLLHAGFLNPASPPRYDADYGRDSAVFDKFLKDSGDCSTRSSWKLLSHSCFHYSMCPFDRGMLKKEKTRFHNKNHFKLRPIYLI